MIYRCIMGASMDSLEDQVNDLLGCGYELVGGVAAVTIKDGSTGFGQAMINRTESAPKKTEPVKQSMPTTNDGAEFYHGVYEDEGAWQVLHMSECEGGEDCRLFKYLESDQCTEKFKHNWEYTVTEVDGKFKFVGSSLRGLK